MKSRALANAAWTSGFTAAMCSYGIAHQLVRKDPSLFRQHTRIWAQGVARGIGLDVQVFGSWRIDPQGTYLFMANHQSHVDIVALFNALPMVPGFLAKAELRRIPLFGLAMEVGGHVFVDRARHEAAREALARAAEEVRHGDSLVVFPEGTRSRLREILPFKKGGFHLARAAGVPVMPVGIRGTAEILPKHSGQLVPGRCEVHVGEPITVERVRGLPLEALMAEVREAISALSGLPCAADRSGA
jgi:1-acyl-sn-glycerol-3-phosphate acyltransferase